MLPSEDENHDTVYVFFFFFLIFDFFGPLIPALRITAVRNLCLCDIDG